MQAIIRGYRWGSRPLTVVIGCVDGEIGGWFAGGWFAGGWFAVCSFFAIINLGITIVRCCSCFFVSFVQLFFDVSDLNDKINSALSSFLVCVC